MSIKSVGGGTSGGSQSFTNVTLSGLLFESATDGIASAGSNQGASTNLTTELNRITTTPGGGGGVRLPTSAPGLTIFVINHGSQDMTVYGAGTDTIDDVTTTTGVIQQLNSVVLYNCTTAGQWYSEGLATGFVRGLALQTLSRANIAANATGTQASGTALTAMLNFVSSAGAAQSVTLPASSPGMNITVMCTTATNTVIVFPSAGGTGTETINALAANAGLTMGALTSTTFNCGVAGQWYSSPRVPA